MSGEASTTGRPPWSVVCWTDSQYLYTEIAGSPGKPPYIEKHALTEGALSKALSFMRSLHEKHCPDRTNYTIPAWPITKALKGVVVSEDTREKTRAVLRRLRLV